MKIVWKNLPHHYHTPLPTLVHLSLLWVLSADEEMDDDDYRGGAW